MANLQQLVDELLVILEGFEADPLVRAIGTLLDAKSVSLALDSDGPMGAIALHAASDPSDEAEMAAACVLR